MRITKYFVLPSVALVLVGLLFIAGCQQKTADIVVQEKQEAMQAEQVRQVGLPNVTRYTEAKRLRYLYELRDRADLTCWVYTRDMNGKLHLVGVGMGFPIPAGTQFSSPQKLTWRTNGGYHSMPQAEPNGVFPPSTAEATWIILMTKNGPKAYYGETRLEAFPERIPGADETQAVWPDGKAMPADVVAPPPATEKDIKSFESK